MTGSTPKELRVIARIGNLGWDNDGTTVEQRARTVLTESAESWKNLAAVNPKKGSSVDLMFMSADQLQESRLAVRALKKTYSNDRKVWLDVKNTDAENRPARLMHRAHDCLTDIESSRSDKKVIKKDPSGKFLSIDDKRIGFSLRGRWRWTQHASARYTAEELELAKAYAEDQ